MKFIYHDIDENNFNNLEKDCIYIKNDDEFSSFLNTVLITDNILLKEEKEVLLFYSLLSLKQKNHYKINSYFDSIDIAYNYYNLIENLFNNNISREDVKKIALAHQIKDIDIVFDIHEKMLEYAEKNKMIPRYLEYYKYKINEKYLKKYKKVVIINKMNTSKKELEILNKLNIEVEYHLYVDKNDFDEEKLILRNISLKKASSEIKAYKFYEEFDLYIYLIKFLNQFENEKNLFITDFANENNWYDKICQNILKGNKKSYLNKGKIYKILNYIYENFYDENVKEYDINKLFFALLDKDFKDFFEINDNFITEIKKLINNNVKYIDFKAYGELSFFKEFNLEKISNKLAKKFEFEANEFLEAVTEVIAIKSFNFKKLTEKEYLKILLKYLDNKNLKLNLDSFKFKVSNINQNEEENYLILNAQESPKIKDLNFILNQKQIQELLSINNYERKIINYYPYIRKIYLSKNVDILYINDEDNDIDMDSFLNYFIFFNNVNIQNIEYSSIQKLKILNKKNKIINGNKEDFLTKFDILHKKENYFNFKLNAYDIKDLFNNQTQLIIKKLIKDYTNIDLDYSTISNVSIGNIIHKIFELCIKEKKFSLDEILEIKNYVLNCYSNNIKSEFFNTYDRLYFTPICTNIFEFFNERSKNSLISEKSVEKNINGLDFSFKIDIIDETLNQIIDIKTGATSIDDKKYMHQLSAYKFLYNNDYDTKLLYIADGNILTKTKEVEYNDFLNSINNFLNLEEELSFNTGEYEFENILRKEDYNIESDNN